MTTNVEIKLPEGQLEGTSATLSLWLVSAGDKVNEGDPVAELETDKVTMEVCAPKTGVIEKLVAKVGDEVKPEQTLGSISVGAGSDIKTSTSLAQSETLKTIDSSQPESNAATSDSKAAKDCISPAVRRLLRENNLTIDTIEGSGKNGRVTRDDVLKYIKEGTRMRQPTQENTNLVEQNGQRQAAVNDSPSDAPTALYAINTERKSRPLVGKKIPHSNMRKSIASHMVESLLHTSPHVTSVFEMDMGNIIEHRKWHKKEFEAMGVKLTFTAYFLAAIVKAAQAVPQVNARFHDDALELFDDINIGVGTALGDQGLVVPVVEQVQEMNLFEIAKSLNAQTEKARNGKLTPSDMKNGTITISNHGVSGSLFATPIIINQPQVAIVGIGKLEKRVVVENINGVDTMVIRPKCYVSLSIDHRALDAHQTNLFLNKFVETIEQWGQ